MDDKMINKYYTISEIAARLNKSLSYIYSIIKEKAIHVIRIGRNYLVPSSSYKKIKKIIAKRKVEKTKKQA